MFQYLVKSATILAMLHMVFGCAWHHGLKHPQSCITGNVAWDCCQHEQDDPDHSLRSESSAEQHDHGMAYSNGNEYRIGHPGECEQHQPSHGVCQDDRCIFTLSTNADDESAGQLQICHGGIWHCPIATHSPLLNSQRRQPGCSGIAQGMRAHLFLTVQII
jgi:hypothetical protein